MVTQSEGTRFLVKNTLIGSKFFTKNAPIVGFILHDRKMNITKGVTLEEACALVYRYGALNAQVGVRGESIYLKSKNHEYCSLKDDKYILPIIDRERKSYQCDYSSALQKIADEFLYKQTYGTKGLVQIGLKSLVDEMNRKWTVESNVLSDLEEGETFGTEPTTEEKEEDEKVISNPFDEVANFDISKLFKK